MRYLLQIRLRFRAKNRVCKQTSMVSMGSGENAAAPTNNDENQQIEGEGIQTKIDIDEANVADEEQPADAKDASGISREQDPPCQELHTATDKKVEVAEGVYAKKYEEVFLRIYDLSNGMAKVMSKQLLGFQVDGVWHTSIEAFGNEYYFQNGLVFQATGTTHYGPHIDRISLGYTDCDKKALEEFFEMSRHTWRPDTYDLFENNCNNFSNYLAGFLVEKEIPAHILDLPKQVKDSPFFKQFFGERGGF